jgi:hydrogenase maturation protease
LIEREADILILGVGNVIVRDDGVGVYAARELAGRIPPGAVDVEETDVAGIELIDILAGYEKALIIDAIKTDGGVPGTVYRLTLDDFERTVHLANIHGINLPTAVKIGRGLEVPMPEEVIVLAVEVENITEFGETMTDAVAEAVPTAVEMAMNELAHWGADV